MAGAFPGELLMSRTVKLAAFNIVTHPHSPAGYSQLFLAARSLRQPVKIWGETHGLLATAYRPRAELDLSVITGEIFTFLQLDQTLGWFDIVRGEEATDEQIEAVNIPEELRPHLKKIRYVLFPGDHVFVYAREDSHHGSISPTPMQNFLERLLNDNRLLEKTRFQEVEVRLIQDRRELTEILERITLERLEIFVELPNAGDTPGDAEEKVAKEMEEENLKELEIIKKAADERGLHPNENTKDYMTAAASNGYVKARGTTAEGEKKEYNTQTAPLVESFDFPDNVPYLDRFLDVANQLRKIIKRKR
jgi:hypothetical protein